MDIKEIIEILGFVVLAGGVLWNFAKSTGASEAVEKNLNTKIDQHIEDNRLMHDKVNNLVTKLFDWKDRHEAEVSNNRLEVQKQIGKLEGGLAVTAGQYTEILRQISEFREDVSEKIEKLEDKIGRMK